MAGLLVDLVETDFFGIGSGGIQSDREVTSERRKKPFQLARGAIGYSKRNWGTADSRRIGSIRSDSQF
jgi:hypothetical protein